MNWKYRAGKKLKVVMDFLSRNLSSSQLLPLEQKPNSKIGWDNLAAHLEFTDSFFKASCHTYASEATPCKSNESK